MRDFLDRELNVGDLIVYPSMGRGNSVQTVLAEILHVGTGSLKVRIVKGARYAMKRQAPTHLWLTQNVVKVELPS